MRLTLRTAAFLFTLYLAFTLLLGGCCTEKARIIGLGTPLFIDTAGAVVDTIRSPFHIEVSPIIDLVSIQVPTPYAFSCDWENLNLIDSASLRLQLDMPLVVDTETIPAGTDLLAHPLTRNLLDAEVFEAFRFYGSVQVWFGQSFLAGCTLPEGPVSFTLHAATDDGQALTTTASAFWKG